MKEDDVRKRAFAMPLTSPAYPQGPYRFLQREYLIIAYRTDADKLHQLVPEPLEVDQPVVRYEFIRMPDSTGFGDYTESSVVIPAKYDGTPVNFTAQMYLDDEPPIAGGREVWGFPKKNANPRLSTIHDTLTGILEHAGVRVAVGTMGYKHQHLLYDVAGRKQCSTDAVVERMRKTQVNLKLIPEVDGTLAIAQLVAYELDDIQVKGAWSGPARCSCTPMSMRQWRTCPSGKCSGGCISLPISRFHMAACSTTTRNESSASRRI
jgi:acetoacetate decarboxylase